MIKAVQNYLSSIPAVFIDGLLYVCITWFTFNQSYFGSDEAAKYIPAAVMFWLNWVIGSIIMICTAIKMFRSTGFADHQAKKQNGNSGNTTIITKQ